MKFHGAPVSALASVLSSVLQTLVVDRTGITGLFDYTLTPYQSAAQPGDTSLSGSTDTFEDLVITAVKDQLRLKLQEQKLPIEITVIDHVEKPSEN